MNRFNLTAFAIWIAFGLGLSGTILLTGQSGNLIAADEKKADEKKADENKAETKDEHAAESEAGHDHAEGGDHGHADMDLTHGDAPADLEAPNAIRADKALFTLVVFGLLLTGLYLVAWKPIMAGLSKREADIQALIAKTEQASNEAAAKLKEYEVKLQSAAEEAQKTIAQARLDAEAAGQRILTQAQEEAKRQKDLALADIESAKRVALTELSSKSTDLAFALARRIVARELKPEDHQQLIQEVLGKLPSRN